MTYENYIQKVDLTIDFLDLMLDKLIATIDVKIRKPFNYLYNVITKYSKFVMDNYYGLYRRITWPTGKIILKTWKYFKFAFKNPDLLKRPAIHTLMGPPGCGKSLAAYLTVTEAANETGKAAFVNTKFEKSQPDENGRKFKIHQYFTMDELFDVKQVNGNWVGYQKRGFSSRNYRSILYDEVHTIFNNRQNRTKEYMLLFVPFMRNMVLYRHEGFHSIFLLTQITQDVQLMSISNFIHKPETILDINYERWIQDGRFELVPVQINFQTYTYNDGKLTLYKTWSKKVDYRLLETFNTHAYKRSRHMPLIG